MILPSAKLPAALSPCHLLITYFAGDICLNEVLLLRLTPGAPLTLFYSADALRDASTSVIRSIPHTLKSGERLGRGVSGIVPGLRGVGLQWHAVCPCVGCGTFHMNVVALCCDVLTRRCGRCSPVGGAGTEQGDKWVPFIRQPTRFNRASFPAISSARLPACPPSLLCRLHRVLDAGWREAHPVPQARGPHHHTLLQGPRKEL